MSPLIHVALAMAVSAAPAPNAPVSFIDGAGQHWCGVLLSYDRGPGGAPYAWISVGSLPVWTAHIPVALIGPACTP